MRVKQCGHSIGPSPEMLYTRHYIGLEIPIQTYVIVRFQVITDVLNLFCFHDLIIHMLLDSRIIAFHSELFRIDMEAHE